MANQSTRFAAWPGRTRMLVGVLSVAVVGVVAAAVVTKGGVGSGTAEASIPAGTNLIAALEHTVTTEHSDVGQEVTLRTSEPLNLAKATIPAGVVLHGEITRVKGGGRIAGAPELTMRFTQMEVNGKEYPIAADPFRVRGKDDLPESIAEIGGGAVVGGVVGGIAGHGAGDVAKGAVVGAVIGTGVAVATKGNQIVLPAGQKLRIRLAEGVRVKYRA
jgi:hypothetical protein